MQSLNLEISNEVLNSFKNSLSMLPEKDYLLGATKGESEEIPKATWTFGIVPMEIANSIREVYMHDCMVEANGEIIFVYPFDLLWELEEKKFAWGEDFIELQKL